MELPDDYECRIAEEGFAIVDGVLPQQYIDGLRDAFASMPEGEEVRRRANIYGVRNLLEVNEDVRQLAALPAIRSLVIPVLGQDCFAVRATFFDKVADANWNLSWHQDGVISVKEQVGTPGFSAWANKAGTIQVRPPEGVLSEMLAIRIHLDNCPKSNGALKVLVGSHLQQWQKEDIEACKVKFRQTVCEVGVGGVVAMRPLLLHASSASESPGHRRVVHIEFANAELPGALEWNQRIAP